MYSLLVSEAIATLSGTSKSILVSGTFLRANRFKKVMLSRS
jgi:hypothetical protein